MIARTLPVVLAALCALGTPHVSRSEPRALLVGISKYQLPNADLPGIDLDIENMKDLAQVMGFKPGQIHIVQDQQATLERVTREMSTWLREGVGPNDPVLFYFSGHGTRILDTDGDEADGADEVLVMHDTRWSKGGTREMPGLRNSLVDDQISSLVGKIPSKRVLLLIDACNSGTASRDISLSQLSLGTNTGYRKFYYYPGMPKGVGTAVKKAADAPDNFAALAAAGDTESAISTDQGGVFTLGLVQSIRAAAQAHREISLAELRTEVTEFITKRLAPAVRYTPVTTGRSELVEGELKIIPLENGNGPAWQELSALAKRGEAMPLTSNQPKYKLGDEVELKIEAPRAGYLNVISVDAADNATVLFPNKYRPDNQIKAGTFSFPTADMPFTLPAVEPVGRTLVVAFLSDQPVNALELGIEGRDKSGKFAETFTSTTKLATRAIGVAARAARASSASLEVVVEGPGK